MTWYYVDAGQQAGPVDDAQLEELSRSGKIQPETLVWREGMANWEPYSKVKPATGPVTGEPPMPGAPLAATTLTDKPKEAVCSECGRTFGTADMIQHHGRYICAGCKPIFFQRLREGAGPAPGGYGAVSEEQVLAREYEVDLGTTMSQAWEAFKANAGIIIGSLIVVGLLFIVGGTIISVVAAFLGPYAPAAQLLGAIYTMPLMGGLLWLMLNVIRKKEGTIGDCFVGFSGENYRELLLYGIFSAFLNLLIALPVNLIMQSYFTGTIFRPGSPPNFPPEAIISIIFFALFAWIAILVMNTLFVYVLLLIIDKKYDFWPAIKLSCKMVMRRWWMTFLFVFVSGLLAGLGVCACIVGLLVTVPLYFGMLAALYDRNFADLRPQ